MPDDRFEPRIGRMRAARSPRGRKYLNAVLSAAMRAGLSGATRTGGFAGSRLGRGAAVARLLGSRGPIAGGWGRRVVVKTRVVRLAGRGVGGAAAHLRYIQRDGVGRDGGTGELYSSREDAADGGAFLGRCEHDRHQFRFIVSAEDGAAYDNLRPLIRRFMARMEEDLGTGLEWVAADHTDTLRPHTHVILRGKDDRGADLVIAPEYIARGMRERACELVSLDLGPRNEREIEDSKRREVDAERLTAIDRRLLRTADEEGVVGAGGRTMFERALQAGRLRKLSALGLAEGLADGRWRLAEGLEDTLRALGERHDIVRTMQRALTAAGMARASAEQRVFDPACGTMLTGRVLARGLGDEARDRHFLLVDGIDGRVHYVDIGAGDALEPLPDQAIVQLAPRAGGVRESDRTVAAIATANGGRYSAALHHRHDPEAAPAFVDTHVRRLEAQRRSLGLERDEHGVWTIPGDHLARAERLEARAARAQPVVVAVLSPLPLERLTAHDGETWLDRALADGDTLFLRDAGFGREVRAALAMRRAWLLRQGLAIEDGGRLAIAPQVLAGLRARELRRVAAVLAEGTGKVVLEPAEGARVEGTLRRRLDLACGRFGVVENGHELALVPWRPVLARALGKPVSGIMRETGTHWTIGRERSLGR